MANDNEIVVYPPGEYTDEELRQLHLKAVVVVSKLKGGEKDESGDRH